MRCKRHVLVLVETWNIGFNTGDLTFCVSFGMLLQLPMLVQVLSKFGGLESGS